MTTEMAIPSADVPGYVGVLMRRRESMEREGGELNGFMPPRADDTMPAYSLYGEALAKPELLESTDGEALTHAQFTNLWARHVDWMRATYDVRTLALGVYDYILTPADLREYASYYDTPAYQQDVMDARNVAAKAAYAKAKRMPEGVMYADWEGYA